jgi:hypothetical protein
MARSAAPRRSIGSRDVRSLALLVMVAWALAPGSSHAQTEQIRRVAGVSAARAAPTRVFIETEVDPHDPYVQAAARVTVRVYSARALYRSDLDLPAPSDALVRQVGSDDHGTAKRDNRAYDVLTRRYLVFPQRSGKLNIPGAVLNAQILTSTGRSNPYSNDPSSGVPIGGPQYAYGALSIAVQALMMRGDAILLDVRPRPTGTVSSYWMPARQVSLASEWHPQASQAHVGDAFTLSVEIEADGLPAEQLPDVSTLLKVPPGLKAYPDEPKLDTSNRGDTLVGRREQSIALIADEPGRFTLPELQLRWWDTARNLPQVVRVPARTVTVLPAAAATANAARTASPAQGAARVRRFGLEDPWHWVTLALALAWLATLGGWYGTRRRAAAVTRGSAQKTRSVPAAASRARARFLEACHANDATGARLYLLAWASAEWPRPPPAGLNGMAKLSGDSELGRLLRELDRACYAGGTWQGEPLARALAVLPAPAARPAQRTSPLDPLYH